MNDQKGFSQIYTISIVVGLVIVVGIVLVFAQMGDKAENATMEEKMEVKVENKDSSAMMENEPVGSMQENSEAGGAMENESMSASDSMNKDAMMEKPDSMMSKMGSYKDYSAATVEAEQKSGSKVVLFFHAPWCPYCKAANTEFLKRANEIPSGVTVLKTDYDSNPELKQKYGVTYQHTFVQIDSQGNSVSKWNGGDIDNLKKYLK